MAVRFNSPPLTLPTNTLQTGFTKSTTPATTATPATGTSQQAATASNADVFKDPTLQSNVANYNKVLGSMASTGGYKGPDEVTGEAEIAALLDPAKAKDLLANGVKDPTTGRPLKGPIDPNSDIGKELTKVANGQPVTATELSSAASLVKDKALVSKSFMDNFFNQLSTQTQTAIAAAQEAAKKGDPGAV